MRVRALKVDLRLSCHGSGAEILADDITRAWDWCLPESPGEPVSGGAPIEVGLLLEEDPELLAATGSSYDLAVSDLPTLMDQLSPLITRLAVGAQAGRLTMLHACALSDPGTGDTAILFGPSGTGKTTLARTLGRRLAYLTDETAAVDEEMRMVAYPKPLSIIVSPGDELKRQVSAGELGLVRRYPDPATVRAVVQLDRRSEAYDDARVERLSTIDALPEMVAQTSYSASFDRPLHHLAGLAHHVGGVHRVTYSEASQLAPVVAALLATGAA